MQGSQDQGNSPRREPRPEPGRGSHEAPAANPPAPDGLAPTCAYLGSQAELSGSATANSGPKDTQPDRERVEPPRAPEAIPRIPGYDVLRFVARGGMGMVLEARHLVLDRTVAIKLPLAHQITCADDRERFLREARAAAKLKHVHICAIHEVGEVEGRPFIVMDFIRGSTLKAWARSTHPTGRQSAEMVARLARAVGYAHAHGVIHRDLKPSNVMVDEELGQPVLTDFGLAKELAEDASQLTQSGQVMGTPAYMAPEQAAGRLAQIGTLSDVYSLGAILYELLCDRTPFIGTAGEILRSVQTDEPTPPRRVQPRVHRDLETVCLKALAREQGDRYESAVALAEDLERFAAGEPILARREGLLQRAWRKARRRSATLATLGVILALACASVGYFAWREVRRAKLDSLLTETENQLTAHGWTLDDADWMEQQLASVDQARPELAATARERWYARFVGALAESFAVDKHPLLQPADIERIEQQLALLHARRPDLAREQERTFQQRLRRLQRLELSAPFSRRAEFFGGGMRVDGDALAAQPASDATIPNVLPLKIACLGDLEMVAEFTAESWAQSRQLGLALNVLGAQSYQFLLCLPDRVLPDGRVQELPAGATFATVRADGGQFSLRILRNGLLLREQKFAASSLPEGVLRLMATRSGNQLALQAGGLPSVAFYDAYSLAGPDPGTFGWCPSEQARLMRLTVATQALAPTPSPLERGDALFDAGKFQEALDEYQRQAPGTENASLTHELRYKVGASLARLGRRDEAAELFEQVSAIDAGRWSQLSACQLWEIRLEQERLADVDTVMVDMLNRYSTDELASVVPYQLRARVLTSFSVQSMGEDFARYDPRRVARLERIVPLADLFKSNDYERIHLHLSLIRAYHLAGDFDRAVELAEQTLADPTLAGAWEGEPTRLLHWQIRVCEEYGWLMRLRQNPKRALDEVNLRLLTQQGGYRRPYLPLLLERARLRAALEEWDAALHDLDELLNTVAPGEMEYRYHSEACLLRGLLLEQKNDLAGAQAAWLQGLHTQWLPAWRTLHPGADETNSAAGLNGTKVLTNMILGGLSGAITDEDTDRILAQMITYIAGDQSLGVFKDTLHLPPPLLIEAWQSPRGRDTARKMSFRSVPLSEFIRLPAVLVVTQIFIRDGLPDAPTEDQRELVWQVADDAYRAYFVSGTIGARQAFPLVVAWKGLTGPLGWAGVANSLDPSLRGKIAYVLGHRYARLSKPDEALSLFRTALADAPAESLLQKLAQAEVDRLVNSPATTPGQP